MIDDILGSWAPLASWILFASLKSSVIIACVLMLRRLQWLTPQGRYGLWFAVIACLSMPFGAEVNLRNDVQTVTTETFQPASQPAITAHSAPLIAISESSAVHGSMVSLQSWLILAWIAGAALLATAVLYNTSRYARIKATSTETDAATRALLQQCRETLRIRKRVRLVETSQIASPIVVGYWRPTLLLPIELSTQVTREQLRLVLLHELAHVARHDILVNWLITFVQIAHWFNPLSWYALRAMRADMELACDATVMRNLSGSEQLAYGDTLIRLSDFTPQRSWLVQNASVVESHAQLRMRIRMISRFKPGKTLQSAVAAILLLIVTAVGITQTSNEADRRTSTASRTQPPSVISMQGNTPPTEAKKPVAGDSKAKSAARSTTSKGDSPAALQVASIQVSYVKASDLAEVFSKPVAGVGQLSEKGSIMVEPRTNTLLVRDTQERITAIRQLVATLDVPAIQIMFEAHIVRIDDEFARDLLARGVRSVEPGAISTLAAEYQLEAELAAGARRQQVEIISAPRITIANRQKGIVTSGTMMPTSFTQAGDPQGPMKKVGLDFTITPTVTPDRQILADVSLTFDTFSIGTAFPGAAVPSINTRQFSTQVLLHSGVTVMLDQLSSKGVDTYVDASPDTNKDRRLVVFITPSILADPRARTQGP